jgi:tetratricopeptide (TPR) repeat protein
MTQFKSLLLAVSITTACAGLPATAKWIPETFENPLPEAAAYLGGSVEEHRLEMEHKKHANDIADVETSKKEEPSSRTEEEEPAPRPKRLAPVYHAAPPPAELDPEPHFRKALKATKDKKYEDAIKELKIALELKPAYYEAQAQLALVYQVVGQDKKAERLYTELLELRPSCGWDG